MGGGGGGGGGGVSTYWSEALSGFLEWCANKNGDQIVSLKGVICKLSYL